MISSRLFHPVASLVILDLSSNLLAVGCETCLGPTSFQGLGQLVVLNLAANRLTSLLTQPAMFQACGATFVYKRGGLQLDPDLDLIYIRIYH